MLNSAQQDAGMTVAPPSTNSSSAESAQLLRQAQEGDAAAFCELCRPLESRLRRQALALCGDLSLADDLAQETLVEVWRCLGQFHGRCQLFTWICAIMLNRYRSLRRRKRPLSLATLSDAQRQNAERRLDSLADDTLLPDVAADQAERNTFLQQALDALPHRQRAVIYLRFYGGESLEEVACALRISVGTVKSRLFHGLEKLRKMNVLRGKP